MPLYGEEKRRYQREFLARRRREWIDSRGGACEACGSMESLEVDHVDPSLKTMQPASIWSRRAEVREMELENCQVLCRDCHSDKTRTDREPPHGTHSRYVSAAYRCRCAECKAAHAKLARSYRSEGRKW